MDDQEEDEVWWFLVSELPCFASQVTFFVFGEAAGFCITCPLRWIACSSSGPQH